MIREIPDSTNRVSAFNPDGTRLIVSGADDLIQMWDSSTGRPIRVFPDSSGPAEFSPDGRYVVTSGADGTVRLWNTDVGTAAGAPIAAHSGPVDDLAFNSDGSILASAGDNTIRLWDPAMGQPIGGPLTGYAPSIGQLQFSPNGSQLTDGTRLWNLALYLHPLESLCEVAGNVTPEEWTSYAGEEPYPAICPPGPS